MSYAESRSTLAITIYRGETPVQMEVYDRDVLSSYGKDAEILVLHDASSQEGKEYEASAFFVIRNSQVTSIKLFLQTLSDIQASIVEWPIVIGEHEITYGEEKKIQSNWPSAPSKEYVLPETIRTGAPLPLDTERPEQDLIARPNVSSGDSPIIYTQTSKVAVEKYADYRRTHQSFWVEFSVTNNSTLATSNTRVMAEFQKQDGTWAPFTSLYRGVRHSEWNWNCQESANDPFFVPQRSVEKVAFELRLELPLEQTLHSRNRCVAMSLPVPLSIRFCFTDQDGKSSKIEVVVPNRNLDLVTFDSLLKDNTDLKRTWLVDHHANGERFGAYYTCNKEKTESSIRFLTDSTTYRLDTSSLHSHTMHALKEQQSSYEIAKFASGDYKGFIHLLIDLELKYAYGIRVQVSTPHQSIDDSFLLPKEAW